MRSPTGSHGETRSDGPESLALLRRVLEHEAHGGYADRAVVGGLGGFLATWLARWPANQRERAKGFVAPLSGYDGQPPAERRLAVEAVLHGIDDAESVDRGLGVRDRGGEVRPAREGPRLPPAGPPARKTVDEGERPRASSKVPRAGGPAGGNSGSRPATTDPAGPSSETVGDLGTARHTHPDDPLAEPVTTLRGVGTANAERLHKLGVATIHDLLYHFPRHHLDYRSAKLIRDLSFEGFETILASVWKVKVEPKPGGLLVIRVTLADESGTADVVWIRRKDYFSQELTTGRTIVLSGECRIVGGRPVFKDPEWEHYSGEDTVHTARLVPVYPLVEGLNGRFMRRIVKQAVDRYASLLPDPLPVQLRTEQHLMDLPQAIAQAHYPDSDDLKASGQRRLAFDELLVLQIGVLRRRRFWDSDQPAPALDQGDERLQAFLGALPFRLTDAQERSLAAVRERIRENRPMSLLLEGDVGSGKTVVAAAAMIQTTATGYQAAIMAPTELLAEQHFQTLQKLFAGLGDNAPRVTLLTGSVKSAERRQRYAAIKEQQVDVVVGTQALVQEGLEFARLGLVVVDEQHRFGVSQRSILRQKGYNPHVLVMTATPIPRTLALTLYGDLDLAVIDVLPPGRQVVKTRHLRPTDRPKAYEFLRREVRAEHQAFVICPLVEESERTEARAATAEYERLRIEVFPDLRLGLLHGRLKPGEKDAVMRQFQRRELDVLVSTAVVEVGIDVPNATVMLIEGANHFGLAQLHQFRGRVGRGEAQAYCLLISDTPGEASLERLNVMERTHDGFDLAEEDLRLRGPGEFFGTRQSGLPDFKVARWSDVAVLGQARSAADRLAREDPDLTAPEHRLLRQLVERFWQGHLDLN
ncbi:MAG TPA: ATP-dependent DNA helicase RecG [Chloroflexota bacterium]|nr:ATP-dependent DNA helicase RecG [Chloroflexota bacterium]